MAHDNTVLFVIIRVLCGHKINKLFNSLSSVDEKDLCKSVSICGPYRYIEQKISPMQRLISEKLRIFAVS